MGFNFFPALVKLLSSNTDVIQLTLALKMTTAQVVKTSVTVNNNSPIQDYFHPDDQTQPTFVSLLVTNQSSTVIL